MGDDPAPLDISETKRSVTIKFSQNVKLDMEAQNHKKQIRYVIYRPKVEKTRFLEIQLTEIKASRNVAKTCNLRLENNPESFRSIYQRLPILQTDP